MAETAGIKRSISLDLDAALIGRAEAIGLDIADVAERALTQVIRNDEPGLTEAEIAAAVRFWNDYDAKHLAVADDVGSV